MADGEGRPRGRARGRLPGQDEAPPGRRPREDAGEGVGPLLPIYEATWCWTGSYLVIWDVQRPMTNAVARLFQGLRRGVQSCLCRLPWMWWCGDLYLILMGKNSTESLAVEDGRSSAGGRPEPWSTREPWTSSTSWARTDSRNQTAVPKLLKIRWAPPQFITFQKSSPLSTRLASKETNSVKLVESPFTSNEKRACKFEKWLWKIKPLINLFGKWDTSGQLKISYCYQILQLKATLRCNQLQFQSWFPRCSKRPFGFFSINSSTSTHFQNSSGARQIVSRKYYRFCSLY